MRSSLLKRAAPSPASKPASAAGLKRVHAPLPSNQELLRRQVAGSPALDSPGRPLDSTTRKVMESRFQHDFSPVRIHFGSEAAQSAQALGAKAYTAGHDIVLNSGALDAATSDFHSPKGQRLLVHELAHVVQQEKTNAPKGIGSRGDRSEVQADRLVDSLGWGGLRHQYGTVSRMHTPHPGQRPPPAQPDL